MRIKNSAIIVLISIVIAIGLFSITNRNAQQNNVTLGLASINKANVIVYDSPNTKANKLWKLNHKNWPIIVLAISKNWVKITDFYNTTGWIKKANVGKPYALVLQETYALGDNLETQIAKLCMNASVEFLGVHNEHNEHNEHNQKYCKIKIKGKTAFVECQKLGYKLTN